MNRIKIIVISLIVFGLLVSGGIIYYFKYYKIAPKQQVCEIQNCHGLEISCGPNPVEICTEIYEIGDICRKYAQCGLVGGQCQQVMNPQFEACKSCVESCQSQYPSDPQKQFSCENNCGQGNQQVSGFVLPIANFKEGQTKKVFGQYITPATSPVQPEKFTGYHTGVDIEQVQDNTDVPVYAIADGKVRFIGSVSGYGGVIIIEFSYNNETYTALYGHIRLSSATVKVGDTVTKSEQLAVLGTGYSSETDGERKHLHFAIHKGANIDYRGYVQNQSDLSNWIDPNSLIN